MPNIRRSFPGKSLQAAAADPSSEEEEDDDPQDYYPPSRGGGKQLAGGAGGKYFRPPTQDAPESSSEDDDDDDDESEQETPAIMAVHRGGGKQMQRPGKMLRPPLSNDSDEESEDDELQDDEDDLKDDEPPSQPVRVAQRGGGKTLMRMRPPSDSESDNNDEAPPQRIVPRTGGKSLIRPPEDDPEDSDSEEEAPEKVVPVRPRTGGKMLSMMQPPADSDDDDEDEEEDISSDEEENVAAVRPSAGGGKQLRPPGGGKQLRPPSGGKQLRPPPSGGKQLPPAPVPEEPKPATASIMPNTGGGKQLRRAGPGGGGKQLRRHVEDSDSEDEDAEPKTTAASTTTQAKPAQKADGSSDNVAEKPVQVARPSGGGKQLVRPAGPGKTGKQLRRPPAKAQEEEESSEEDDDFGDDSDDSSSEESDYEEAPKKGKGKKKPAPKKAPAKPATAKSPGRPRRAAASRKQIVVEEEEEIFGDDDISSDDDSSDEEMELDENNTEALIKDEEDRKYLDSLPELEREAILGERFEKLKEQYDMKKAMREAKKAKAAASGKAEPKKKKADKKKKKSTDPGTEGDEELARKLAGAGVREKREAEPSGAKSKKAAALAALKKNRKIQKQAAGESSDDDSEDDFADDSDEEDDDEFEAPWQKAARDSKKKTSSRLDDGMDDDDDEEMEDVEASKKAKDLAHGASKPIEAEAGLEDFRKVTIPRDKLRDWCNEPYFKAAVLECFVRVTIGEDDRGVRMHRLCEIVDVTPVDVAYKFPLSKKGEKPVTTNLKLKLRFGTSERDFAMYLVSNASPSLEDLQKYTTAQLNNRLEILSKRRANKLYRLQQNLVENYTYTTEDIEKNLQKRKKLGKLSGNLGGEKTKATIALQAAEDAYKDADNKFTEAKLKLMEAGDDDDMVQLDKAVKESEDVVKQAKKILDEKQAEARRLQAIEDDYKRRLKSRSRDRNWAKVNARALKENQRADREAHKEKADKADVTNLSARRKVKPKVLWKVGQGDDEEKEEEKADASENPFDKPQEKNDTEQPTLEAPPTLVQEVTVSGDSAHQFAIDEEALAKDSLASLVVGGHKAKKRRIRKGISLEEYFERKEKGTL